MYPKVGAGQKKKSLPYRFRNFMITSLKQEYCDSGPSLICCVREQKKKLTELVDLIPFFVPKQIACLQHG